MDPSYVAIVISIFTFRYIQRFRSESKLRSEAAYYYTQMVRACVRMGESRSLSIRVDLYVQEELKLCTCFNER